MPRRAHYRYLMALGAGQPQKVRNNGGRDLYSRNPTPFLGNLKRAAVVRDLGGQSKVPEEGMTSQSISITRPRSRMWPRRRTSRLQSSLSSSPTSYLSIFLVLPVPVIFPSMVHSPLHNTGLCAPYRRLPPFGGACMRTHRVIRGSQVYRTSEDALRRDHVPAAIRSAVQQDCPDRRGGRRHSGTLHRPGRRR